MGWPKTFNELTGIKKNPTIKWQDHDRNLLFFSFFFFILPVVSRLIVNYSNKFSIF